MTPICRSFQDIDSDVRANPPQQRRRSTKTSDRIGKPPPKGLITYTAHYLADTLTELHNYQDYPCVYPWDRQAQPYYPPEIKPRLEGVLKVVQRKDNGTWVVVETIPNGKQEDTHEDATTLFGRLERLERIILNSKPPPQTPAKKGGVAL